MKLSLNAYSNNLVEHHLGETEPQTPALAEVLFGSSSSSSQAPMVVNKEGDQQKRERSPETSVEPRGKRGNPNRRSASAQERNTEPENRIEPRGRTRTRSPSKKPSQSTALKPIAEPKPKGRPKAEPKPKSEPIF